MRVIDIIRQAEANRAPRFTIELLPPLKGDGTQGVFSAIDTLVEYGPAYINVTFQREDEKLVEREDGLWERRVTRRRPGTVGISAAIMQRYGIEAVPHLICGGLSRYDIEDALIDMDFLGIENVLALRGDSRRTERRFAPHPDGHAYADGLVRQIAAMNEGEFVDGEVENCHKTHFCIGVAGYPEKHSEAPNLATDIDNLRRKIDAGAEYIVTQMCFDNQRIFEFIDRCRAAGITVPIVPGLKPFTTKAQLTVLPQTFHVDLPEELVAAVAACKDNRAVREVGIEWATMQARELKAAGLPVIHFYTMSRTDNVAQIVKNVF
ncbi:MAG: methylenetetrahydrofolate reductase [Rikenellaceae bacterium]|nr:methylenetetrahydrofolate reductase [Rikenellaceae bacterium]MBQ9147618.1 methylenetetrahydrofolate reductase [Rikenellaceae bacterium]MBR2050295.1 methylenetetrahydrofolate reductase [Rikenellaceae bacterium]MBR2419148.1 methylenetetrahydrofolate reductase [Rikenellaceae bacterium]MBR2931340.1 methylenetetrahydrofolate reductase [Rikenellaceae bacterium]